MQTNMDRGTRTDIGKETEGEQQGQKDRDRGSGTGIRTYIDKDR